MEIITEDYVSFETAKLLKEKGFDCACEHQYINCSSGHPFLTDIRDDAGCYYKNTEIGQDEYSAPTLQMAKKWVRKVYNLFIEIQCYGCEYDEKAHFEYSYVISEYIKINTGDCTIFSLKKHNAKSQFLSPEQACDSAIKYCLENLI